MNIREHANALLASFAEKLQGEVEVPPLDDSDISVFLVSNIVITAALAEEVNSLVVSILIGNLPDGSNRATAVRELARGNFHWGGTDGGIIGIEDGTDLVYLHRRLELPVAETSDFIAILTRQIGVAKYWAKTLAQDSAPPISPTALRA